MSATRGPENDAEVRLHVYGSVVEKGRPPAIDAIGPALGLAADEVAQSLDRLAAGRALILSQNRDRIAVVPPFSCVPTPFWVTTPRGSWWGNCAWESLGVAALLGSDATIRTTVGARGDAIDVRVEDGRVVPDGLRVHVPLPARRWWDDVGFTCSTILFFRSDDEVDRWSAETGLPRGRTIGADQTFALARRWFTGRLDPAWRRLTPAEARASFDEAGLVGDFWQL